MLSLVIKKSNCLKITNYLNKICFIETKINKILNCYLYKLSSGSDLSNN